MAAEIWPDEGLDWALDRLTGNAAAPTNLYVGLFTSQTPTTVPARTAVLATQTGVTEAAYSGYARVAIAPADWGAPSTNGNGRIRAAAQKAFAAAGASYATQINGFFVASALSGGVALFYSNFTGDTPIASLALGDVPRVTPSMQADG